MSRRIALCLLALSLLLPIGASANEPGSLWDLKAVPDVTHGGFWVLAQGVTEDGDGLVVIRFNHDGQVVGDLIEVASPATPFADIGAAETGLVVVAWLNDEGAIAARTIKPDGELGDEQIFEAPAIEAAPVVLLDPSSDDVAILWHGYDQVWATWTVSISAEKGIPTASPRTCSEGWGDVAPAAFGFSFVSDGTAVLLAETDDGLFLTDFDPGLIGTDDDPVEVEDAGTNPTGPSLIFDYDDFAYLASWTSEDDGESMWLSWLDPFAEGLDLEVLLTTDGDVGRADFVEAFDQIWMAWSSEDAGGFSIDGLKPTGPGDVGDVLEFVADGANPLQGARLAFNEECPNVSLFYSEDVDGLLEPRMAILQSEDPCELGDDDDSAPDDDDCEDGDGDGSCDEDDPCPNDPDDTCNDRTCGARASTAGAQAWTLVSILAVLLGTLGLVRRRS